MLCLTVKETLFPMLSYLVPMPKILTGTTKLYVTAIVRNTTLMLMELQIKPTIWFLSAILMKMAI